jgi:N-dimethylarginine dimethylaminohydrolase
MTEAAKLISMARYLARNAVKERLRDCGIRPIEVEPSEIRKATDKVGYDPLHLFW